MEDYVIAINSDGRVEAFYIDENSTVMHVWQLKSSNKTVWSQPRPLFDPSSNPNSALTNATRVSAATGRDGQIQVVAYTRENKYFTCYQESGTWNGWFEITQ
ncbi:MAG: hypothetical protein HRT69_18525 [Flavobacteriaceae bacterium]|nr:hypothetical protein [Flavobacteriaceae bacterium]